VKTQRPRAYQARGRGRPVLPAVKSPNRDEVAAAGRENGGDHAETGSSTRSKCRTGVNGSPVIGGAREENFGQPTDRRRPRRPAESNHGQFLEQNASMASWGPPFRARMPY